MSIRAAKRNEGHATTERHRTNHGLLLLAGAGGPCLTRLSRVVGHITHQLEAKFPSSSAMSPASPAVVTGPGFRTCPTQASRVVASHRPRHRPDLDAGEQRITKAPNEDHAEPHLHHICTTSGGEMGSTKVESGHVETAADLR